MFPLNRPFEATAAEFRGYLKSVVDVISRYFWAVTTGSCDGNTPLVMNSLSDEPHDRSGTQGAELSAPLKSSP